MRRYKRKFITRWKCQDCGYNFETVISFEPLKGIKCPCCGRRGVKLFRGKYKMIYKRDRLIKRELVEEK